MGSPKQTMKLVYFAVVVGCAAVSGWLIADLWRKQKGGVLRKLLWSVVICIPVMGWIFYGGFFSPPDQASTKDTGGGASGWYNAP